MEKIGIFCAASQRIAEIYVEKARELGAWLGKKQKVVVYGGSNVGLMEVLALSVKENGGRIYGVIPTILETNSMVSRCIDVEFRCQDLSDRKQILEQESDILIALPGGVGTLDEIFTIVASNAIGYHKKKVVLYNIEGYWDDLLHLLSEMEKKHFLNHPLEEALTVANSFDELIAQIEG